MKLGFAIPLMRPNEGGLPDAEENQELGEIEDLIAREVATRTTSLHVLTLTTDAMKEFVFYIAPGTDVEKLHKEIQGKVPGHEVQCEAVMEPTWESYRAFTP